MPKNWIAGATKNAHGQFAAAAKKAGMSTAAYASHVLGSNTATTHRKRQAALAKRLIAMRG